MAGRHSPKSMSGDYGNGDEQFALNVVSSIRGRIADMNMTDNEDLCKDALSSGGVNVLINRDGPKAAKKHERKNSTELFQKPLTPLQSQNQALRFGYGATGVTNTRSSWNFFRSSTADIRELESRRDYEDVVDPEILNAPICDVCIVQSKTLPPPGFYRLHKTPTNKKADLNLASSGNPLYLCIKKDLSGALYPITNFIVVFPDRNEYTPPGYNVVNRGKTACNLNSGTTSERIFLCYRKDAVGNPLTDIQVILPTKGEVPPPAFNLIEKSISGIPANLNTGTGGTDVYFCYRQSMSRLNCLLTEPTPAEEDTRARLRSIRRNSMRSFDDADRTAVVEGLPHHQQSQSFSIGTSARPGSGSIQPIAINTLAGNNGSHSAFRFRSVSTSANATTPPFRKTASAIMEVGAAAHAQSQGQGAGVRAHTTDDAASNHGALPSSVIFNIPQALPPGVARGAHSPVNVARSSIPKHPRFVETTGADMPHSVSFSDHLPDTPTSAVHPFEQDEFNASPQNSTRDRTYPSHTSLDTLEEGSLSNSNRDRANSTSTTQTGQANDPDLTTEGGRQSHNSHLSQHSQSLSQDNQSQVIEADRADSDMPMHTDSSNIGLKRRQTYAEFEHPLEGEDFEDDADEEEYAGEMAYLLAQMQQNKRLEVVDSYGTCPPLVRRKALLAILAALYIRQGTVSSAALAGLSDLLKDSNFFAMDLHRLPAPGTTTMIDLTVEAVCDRFELSADGERDSLLRFLGLLTPYCGSKLSLYSLQRIFSACMFLCCHYAITKPELLEASLGSFSLDQDNYDDYDGKDNGVPSFKLFSQLLTDTFRKAEEENVADHLPSVGSYDNDDLSSVASSTLSTTHRAGLALHTQSYLDVKEIVDDFVAGVLDNIEVARLSEVAFHTVSKQSYSTISPPFWKELTALSTTLFEGQGYRSAFVLLGAICKQAWHTVRTKSSGEPVSRDVGVKLVAFGALEQFCMMAGENIRASRIFGYQIRRMVIPCLLYNVSYAFMDHRIFSKMLKLISAIWKHWRRHVRIEFAIICEQFIFKVMQATVVQVRPIFKMIMIQEVTKWFEQPHMLLEMFVNYDMDRKFVSHWSTFSYLVRTFCAIGRRVLYSSAAATPAEAHEGGGIENAVTIRDVHMQALEEVARMAKTLMDASGHAYLILQDSGFRNKSVTRDGGWEDDDCKSPGAPDAPQGTGRYSPNAEMLRTTSAHSDETTEGTPVPNSVSSLNTVATTATGMTTATGVTGVAGANQRRRLGSIRQRRELHQESEALIKKAVEIYTAKNDLKKAVNFLIKSEFLANTPQEIANFLRVYKNSFDPAAIGDFLGEGGKNPAEEEYWTNIRFRYTRAVSFVEMDIEPALRLYLTGCGFRMPGEAQKINRFVEVFVKAFWQDNSGTANCPFKKEDTVHLLAYAIIILNTDLNNVNLDKKGKKRQRMSKEDFFKQLRGCDDGNDIDKEYLTRIYDNIAAQAIELKVTSPDAKISDDTCFVSNPQYYSAAGVSPEVRAVEEKKFVHEMCSSLRDSEDLLRSLSTSSFLFVDTKISLDLVSFMYESVWFHFHTIAEALLNAATSDMFVKITALDILSHALTCAIFLDLKVERMTLAGLLNTFLNKCESLPHVSHVKRSPKIPDNSWYEDVENAYPSTALETISKLHHLFVYIKDMLQESENYENTRQVADKLDKKVRIMEMNSFFVRQGDLAKLSKTKRSTMYRFFLFSDELIYAHLSRGVYVVHEELPLLEMSVEDNPNDPSMCSFFIEHPTKSFQVIAESPSARQYWIRDIGQTIASCKKRFEVSRMSSDVRRMSIFTRIDSQKAVQQQEAAAVKRVAERAASNQANSPGGGMRGSRDEGDAFSPTMSPLTGTSTHPRYSVSSQSVPFVGGVDTPASVDSQSPCSLAGAYLSERDGTKSSRAQDALTAVSDGDQTPVTPTTSTSRHQLSALFDSIEHDDEFSKE
eukprot:gene9092-10735_t